MADQGDGEDAGAGSPAEAGDDVFARLDGADPAGRTEIVLELVERLAGAGVPLDLSARDTLRAVLEEIDLSRGTLEARLTVMSGTATEPEARPGPAWWDGSLRGVVLKGAKLRGARLNGAVLRGADLRGADLREAALGNADLRGARLEGADLRGADLAGAVLRGAELGNADLREAMLEDADLRRAGLRFAQLGGAALDAAILRGADLWGADLEAATLAKTDLRGAVLREAVLRRADLTGALLRRADLSRIDARGAIFNGADLRGASVASAAMPDASLRDARLDDLDFTSCDLTHASLCGASLVGARLPADRIGGAIGEELAGAFDDARKGYLLLERHYQDAGDPDAASWAFRHRRRMQKYESFRLARAARDAGRRREAATEYFDYASDQLVEWLCDYGESASRVVLAMLVIYLAFTAIYGLTGGVIKTDRTPAGVEVEAVTRAPLDLAVFSLLSMTAGEPPSGMEPRDNLIILLAGLQSLFGVALTGLLGFVLGNLVRR